MRARPRATDLQPVAGVFDFVKPVRPVRDLGSTARNAKLEPPCSSFALGGRGSSENADPGAISYFAAIKVQVMPVAQGDSSTIN